MGRNSRGKKKGASQEKLETKQGSHSNSHKPRADEQPKNIEQDSNGAPGKSKTNPSSYLLNGQGHNTSQGSARNQLGASHQETTQRKKQPNNDESQENQQSPSIGQNNRNFKTDQQGQEDRAPVIRNQKMNHRHPREVMQEDRREDQSLQQVLHECSIQLCHNFSCDQKGLPESLRKIGKILLEQHKYLNILVKGLQVFTKQRYCLQGNNNFGTVRAPHINVGLNFDVLIERIKWAQEQSNHLKLHLRDYDFRQVFEGFLRKVNLIFRQNNQQNEKTFKRIEQQKRLLQHDKAMGKGSIQTLNKTILQKKNQLKNAEVNIQKLQNQQQELNNHRMRAEGVNEELRKQLLDGQTQIGNLLRQKSEEQKTSKANIEILQTNLLESQNKLNIVNKQGQALKLQNLQLSKNINTLQESINSLQIELSDKKNDLKSVKVVIQKMENHQKLITGEKNTLETANTQLNKQLSDKINKLNTAERQTQTIQSQNQQLLKQKTAVESNNAILKGQLSDSKNEVNTGKEQLQMFQRQKKQLSEQKTVMERINGQLKKRCSDQESEYKNMTSQLEKVKQSERLSTEKKKTLEQIIENLNSRFLGQQSDLHTAKKQIQTLKRQKQQLLNENKSMQKSNVILTKKLSDNQSQIQTLKRQKQQLSNHNKTLQQNYKIKYQEFEKLLANTKSELQKEKSQHKSETSSMSIALNQVFSIILQYQVKLNPLQIIQEFKIFTTSIQFKNMIHSIKRIKLNPKSQIYETFNEKQTNLLIQALEKQRTMKLKSSRLLYRWDVKNKTKLHDYIQSKTDILLIAKLNTKAIVAGFSQYSVNQKSQEGNGFLASVSESRVLRTKSKDMRVVKIDGDYVIFGNSDFRIRSGENKAYSSLGCINSAFNNEGLTAFALMGDQSLQKSQGSSEVELQSYEFYQLTFV